MEGWLALAWALFWGVVIFAAVVVILWVVVGTWFARMWRDEAGPPIRHRRRR